LGDAMGEPFMKSARPSRLGVIIQLPGKLVDQMPENHRPRGFGDCLSCRSAYAIEHAKCETMKRKHFGPVRTGRRPIDCPWLRSQQGPLHLLAGLLGNQQDQSRSVNRIAAKFTLDLKHTFVSLSAACPADDELH